jgi:hypothetical protein
MALHKDDLQPPKILRAHRPRTSDALQPPGGDVQEEVRTEKLPKPPGLFASHRRHIAAGVLISLGFYLLMTRLVLPFVTDTQEHWNYGSARISQYDLDVGHQGMSHFVTQYYRNQIVVIEMPLERPDQSKFYAVSETVAGDSSQHVVTLTTAYVGRHAVQGKPDLVASVSGFAVPVVLYNTGDGFSLGA